VSQNARSVWRWASLSWSVMRVAPSPAGVRAAAGAAAAPAGRDDTPRSARAQRPPEGDRARSQEERGSQSGEHDEDGDCEVEAGHETSIGRGARFLHGPGGPIRVQGPEHGRESIREGVRPAPFRRLLRGAGRTVLVPARPRIV